MAPPRLKRTKMQRLRPLEKPSAAALAFEKRAGILLGEKSHFSGSGGGREKVKIEAFYREDGLHEPAILENPAMGRGHEKAALMIIGGDGLGVERIDVGELRVLRIGDEDSGEVMIRRRVPIEFGVGVDAFLDAYIVWIGQWGDANRIVAVSERLKNVEFAALDGTGENKMRRGAA